jgi:hypothetical protein
VAGLLLFIAILAAVPFLIGVGADAIPLPRIGRIAVAILGLLAYLAAIELGVAGYLGLLFLFALPLPLGAWTYGLITSAELRARCCRSRRFANPS